MVVLKAADLFAGIGGIRLGFERAFKDEISTVFVSEIDANAQKTYIANFKTPELICGDITRIHESDVPDFDICMAGFPCQAFSIAGKKMGFDDDYRGVCRGTLFYDVARICEYVRPKVIFCENVKGLKIHDGGNTLNVIIEVLENIGYNVFYKILNSKDFGVPQNRERIYIVAFRKDLDCSEFKFPDPVGKAVHVRDILEKDPVSAKYYLSDTYLETLIKHRDRHRSAGNGSGFKVLDLDGVSSALVCGGMGRERNLIIDDRLTDFKPVTRIKGEINHDFIRRLTPRECARLQGFPDSFDLKLSDTQLYKQLGNTVTVSVVEAIANNIKSVLKQNEKVRRRL